MIIMKRYSWKNYKKKQNYDSMLKKLRGLKQLKCFEGDENKRFFDAIDECENMINEMNEENNLWKE